MNWNVEHWKQLEEFVSNIACPDLIRLASLVRFVEKEGNSDAFTRCALELQVLVTRAKASLEQYRAIFDLESDLTLKLSFIRGRHVVASLSSGPCGVEAEVFGQAFADDTMFRIQFPSFYRFRSEVLRELVPENDRKDEPRLIKKAGEFVLSWVTVISLYDCVLCDLLCGDEFNIVPSIEHCEAFLMDEKWCSESKIAGAVAIDFVRRNGLVIEKENRGQACVSDDGRTLMWKGKVFALTPTQASIFQVLLESRAEVAEATIQDRVACGRVADVFRERGPDGKKKYCLAWQAIAKGQRKDTFRIA